MEKLLCSKCQKFAEINKTYHLCKYCNFERLHPGETFFNYTAEKAKKNKNKKISKMKLNVSLANSLENKKQCSILGCSNKVRFKQYGGVCFYHFYNCKRNDKEINSNKRIQSRNLASKQTEKNKKEKIIKNELSKIKKEAKIKHGNICEGCKKSFSTLDYSHILSVGQRKDLELHEDNKNLLCRNCHVKWESNEPTKMLSLACFYDNMRFIRQFDKGKFWKIYFKFNDELMMKECKEIELIDENFIKENGRD